MFYCNDCAKENGYPESFSKSAGICEICGKSSVCNDVPSSALPNPKTLVSETETQGLNPENQGKIFWVDTITGKEVFNPNGVGFKDNPPAHCIPQKLYIKLMTSAKELGYRIRENFLVIDVPKSGKTGWSEGAFTLAFVYSKNKGNFILKGYMADVEKYLKRNYTHYFVYWSMWHKGESRGYWDFWKDNVVFLEPNRNLRRNKRYKYEIYQSINGSRYGSMYEFAMANKKAKEDKLMLKRLPKHWIPEFDRFQ